MTGWSKSEAWEKLKNAVGTQWEKPVVTTNRTDVEVT